MSKRVVVIGIDCATLRHIIPYSEEGVIPNIKRLMDQGAWGNLISTVPPVTCPAWPTLYTGKLPQNHGVFYFTDFAKGGYMPSAVRSNSMKSETFFEIADKNDRQVCVINFPLTYPIRKLQNGYIISGFLTPGSAEDYFHPDELIEHLKEKPFKDFLPMEGYVPDSYADFSKLVLSESRKRQDVMLKLAPKKTWDLFMYCYQEIDVINHLFWKFLDPGFAEYGTDEGEKVRINVKELYSSIDRGVGELFKIFGNEAIYIIASDHGAAPAANFSFHINKFLEEKGLLKSNLGSFKRLLYKNIGFLKKRWDEKKVPSLSTLNWPATKAWSITYPCNYACIFINSIGKYPFGCVRPEEYENTVSAIIELLEVLEHNGKKIIRKIFKKEEIYKGIYFDYAPDITFIMDPDYETPLNFRDDLKTSGIIAANKNRHRISGDHEVEGTYIFSGSPVKPAGRNMDLNIQDLAPTILYLMGLPLPEDMDGKICARILEESYLNSNKIMKSKREGEYNDSGEAGEDYDKLVEAQLKALGYM